MLRRVRETIVARMNRSLRAAIRTLIGEYRIQRTHAKAMREARSYSGKAGLELQCGCGTNIAAGRVNIDLISVPAHFRN